MSAEVMTLHAGESCRYCGCQENAPCRVGGLFGTCYWLVRPRRTKNGSIVAGICSAFACRKKHLNHIKARRAKK